MGRNCANCKHEMAEGRHNSCDECEFSTGAPSGWEVRDDKLTVQLIETLQRARYYIGQILPCNPDLSGINPLLCDMDDALKLAGIQ